ncbi:hypothetical protein RI543_002978 [Arxiozyma heterogenica]|uniref:Lysophospholipase n=1 Tax=Arxiozyma heterogenica TaxID=278026 RepID=A0AAN7WG10_9SACH|nr:hypothetical protein RI543_002978 [Kazachstania heterogenica]
MQLNDVLLALSVLSYVTTTQVNAWSPTNGYAPGNVSCPGGTLIRSATGLSQNEIEWLKKRNPIAKSALHDFLTRGTTNFSNTDLVEKLFSDDKNVPKVGIAASGGGYRAMLSAAGMVAAMDDRTYGADEHGLGGLLQGATYFAGLSGGNWLTTTLAWNNWTSVQDILNNLSATNTSSIWDLENSVLSPGGVNQTLTAQIFEAIREEIDLKVAAGFKVSLVDVWGRALSRYFFPNLPEAGSALTWSSIRDFDVFKNAGMPFPISVADGKYPGSTISSTNSTVFEFNPFEMGSWDPTLNAFTDVQYLGSKVDNGLPIESDQCIAGFDNVGFITGTSADIFNLVSGSSFTAIISAFAAKFLPNATGDDTDIGIYAPNPFKGISTMDADYSIALSKSDTLYLVDGGEDGEVIPFEPLLQKKRDLDVIFAFDNSDDTDEQWPNGNSLVQTYQRQFTSQGRHFAFPYVPTTEVFVKEGLNKRPTFFGCDASNLTELAYVPPLIVYIPNTEYSYASNTSTFKLSYDLEERIAMIQNGFEAMTMGNLTKDPDFVGCVSCAIMRRKQESLNITLPDECAKCFSTYCWNDKSTSISSNLTTSSSNSTATMTLTGGYHNTTLLGSMSATATGKTNSISSASSSTKSISEAHEPGNSSDLTTSSSNSTVTMALTGGYHNTTLLGSMSATATGKTNSISSASSSTKSISEAHGAGNMLNAKNVLGTMALIRVIYSLL